MSSKLKYVDFYWQCRVVVEGVDRSAMVPQWVSCDRDRVGLILG
jgi:hypothetical protein